jgi:hypothetical protein
LELPEFNINNYIVSYPSEAMMRTYIQAIVNSDLDGIFGME